MARLAAVLLAAGESSRMGRPKQLLPWHGTTLIQYQVSQLLATSVHETIVVLGHAAESCMPLVPQIPGSPRLRAVHNSDYPQGKATSVRLGLRSLTQPAQAIVILGVDQPRPAWLLQRLLDAHVSGGHLISAPEYQGRHGHPPIFDGSLIPELMTITEAQGGMREVIRRHRDAIVYVPFDTPLVLVNLNTPEDYEHALTFDLSPPTQDMR